MMPIRIQLRRTKGWRMPPGTVKVDRSTRWGNPWTPGREGFDGRRPLDVEGAVGMFANMLDDPEKRAAAGYPDDAALRASLGGRNLACWCPLDKPCHADVLLRFANGEGEP